MPDRVLLVEDTASLSMLYQSVLTRAGHKVVCAFSLAEARAHFDAVRPHVVLLDLQLPDGDGLDLLRSWRQSGVDTLSTVASIAQGLLAGVATRTVIMTICQQPGLKSLLC